MNIDKGVAMPLSGANDFPLGGMAVGDSLVVTKAQLGQLRLSIQRFQALPGNHQKNFQARAEQGGGYRLWRMA